MGASSLMLGRGSGRPSCWGVEASAVEEVVFDEFGVGVEAQGLVVDEAGFGIRADDEGDVRDARVPGRPDPASPRIRFVPVQELATGVQHAT